MNSVNPNNLKLSNFIHNENIMQEQTGHLLQVFQIEKKKIYIYI